MLNILSISLLALINAQVYLPPQAPNLPVIASSTPQTIIHTYAVKYGVNEKDLTDVIRCESNFNPQAINKSDPNGGSHGISQFQTATFNSWSVKAGIENGDPYNPDNAIQTMAYMFSKGQQSQWSCWQIVHAPKKA
jgi:soluble lytic murein transglycosylase-like protein